MYSVIDRANMLTESKCRKYHKYAVLQSNCNENREYIEKLFEKLEEFGRIESVKRTNWRINASRVDSGSIKNTQCLTTVYVASV